jgi:predicted metal-dependent hydrolase
MEPPSSEILRLPGGSARVQWRRSRRARRVSLRIDARGGAVVVTLPPRAGRVAGMALLVNHAAWVCERLLALPGPMPLTAGALVPLHGRTRRIRHVRGAAGARVDGREILVGGELADIGSEVASLLKHEAERHFSALVAAKAALAGVRPKRVAIKDTRSRWGSCTASRVLSFSWRLVMAPRFVQDYVAAHEVAHIRYMNHGRQFWALVNELTPYTDEAVVWLRDEGPRLLRVG